MKHRTEISFKLDAQDEPLATSHADGSVTLHYPDWAGGHGWNVQFLPAHLPVLYRLIGKLEAHMQKPEPPAEVQAFAETAIAGVRR